MNSDGTAQSRLTTDSELDLYPHWRPVKHPDFTEPKQRIILQSDRSGDEELYEIDLQGNVLRRLTDSPGADGSPIYSPDGSKIAFYSDRNGPDREIFVMNRDLSGLRQLTFNDVDDVSPTWCGNNRIAYMFDYNQIHIMNADGSDSRLLISGQAPICASDGAALLVNQSGNIVTVDPATGVATTLDSGGAAVWSPDGKQIAFDDGKNLFVMDVATKAVTQITNDPATDANPQWAPGQAILFNSSRPGNSDIYVINSDGSGLRNVTVNPARDGQASWWIPESQATPGYARAANYPAGDKPSRVRTGDIDGDGDLDILVGNLTTGEISSMLNNGRGVFGPPTTVSVGGNVVAISGLGDFDSDGDLDTVAIQAPPNQMTLVSNVGDGKFVAGAMVGIGSGANSIEAGDLNRDGHMDVINAVDSPGRVSVYLNGGGGTFILKGDTNSSTGRTYRLAIGDLNGDSSLDVVSTLAENDRFEVFVNGGDGSLVASTTYATQSVPDGIDLADLDNDGDLDVTVANSSSGTISVFTNDGLGHFRAAVNYLVDVGPMSVASGDFNQDGHIDLVTSNFDSDTMSVLTNNGDGTFGAPLSVRVGVGPKRVTVADLNGDMWPDIITANANDVSVILNRGGGLRRLGTFVDVTGRDLNHLHPSGQGVRVGNSYYVVSGESESLGVLTPEIERTRILGNGNITSWEVVGSLPSSRSQAIVAATEDNMYVLGDHPGVTSVLRVPILPDGTLGTAADDRPMLTGRHAGAATVHGDTLYVIGGTNNSLSPTNLTSVERAVINSDGSLGEWQAAPSLNIARSQSAIVKTSKYVWAIGGGADAGTGGTIERAELLAGGSIGPWNTVATEVDPSSSARSAVVGNCIFYVGGSSATGASNRVDCLFLDDDEDITAVIPMPGMTAPRYEPNIFSDGNCLFVTGGAQFEPGPGLKGWKITERATLTVQVDGSMASGAFEQLSRRDLNHLHPNAGSAQIDDSVYVVSGEIESRGIHTPQIERTNLNLNGSIRPWEVVGNLPESRDQATVAATVDDIYIIGNHPGTSAVSRVRVESDGTIGARFEELSLNQPRYNGAAFVHENWLWQIGGANNSVDGVVLASTEHAAINADGSLGPWIEGPELNAARTGFALVKTDDYVYVISGVDRNFPRNDVERAKLLPGGGIGPWELLSAVVPARNLPSATLTEGCIFYGGGSTLTSVTRDDVYCLRGCVRRHSGRIESSEH